MATLKDLRRRIKSVQSTEQITKAMKMVAAAKLRRAQENVEAANPYSDRMVDVLKSLTRRVDRDVHPLLDKRPEEKILLVAVTSGALILIGTGM